MFFFIMSIYSPSEASSSSRSYNYSDTEDNYNKQHGWKETKQGNYARKRNCCSSTEEEHSSTYDQRFGKQPKSPVQIPDTQDVFNELKLSMEEPIEAALERAKQVSLEVGSNPSQVTTPMLMKPIEMYELLWETTFAQIILPSRRGI